MLVSLLAIVWCSVFKQSPPGLPSCHGCSASCGEIQNQGNSEGGLSSRGIGCVFTICLTMLRHPVVHFLCSIPQIVWVFWVFLGSTYCYYPCLCHPWSLPVSTLSEGFSHLNALSPLSQPPCCRTRSGWPIHSRCRRGGGGGVLQQYASWTMMGHWVGDETSSWSECWSLIRRIDWHGRSSDDISSCARLVHLEIEKW